MHTSPYPVGTAADIEPDVFVVLDRGPNWLFLRAPHGVLNGDTLFEQLRALTDQHFTNRLVLEMDRVEAIDPSAVRELDRLCRWLAEQGGVLRFCGLRPECGRWTIQAACCTRLHNHPSRQAAVAGCPHCDDPPQQLPAPPSGQRNTGSVEV